MKRIHSQWDVVLEPFHDGDFPNGVEWMWNMSGKDCRKCSKTIASNSRRTRGPSDGWIAPEDLPKDMRNNLMLSLLPCCYGKKPSIEMRITSIVFPRGNGELDIIILQMRAIENKGEDSINLDTVAAVRNPVAPTLPGRFGFHTTEAHIEDFKKSGVVGGPQDNHNWEWDITRECVHMTPVAPMHPHIWKSEEHSGAKGRRPWSSTF
eukprot:4793562-Amphidinium_carterae.1